MRQQEPSGLATANKIQHELNRRDKQSRRIAKLQMSAIGRIEVRTNELLDKISDVLWKGAEAGSVNLPLAELIVEVKGILENRGIRFLHLSKDFVAKMPKLQSDSYQGENPTLSKLLDDLSSLLDLIPDAS